MDNVVAAAPSSNPKNFEIPLNARRQHLVAHLHAAGARPTLEALLAVARGEDIDDVLEDFGRIPVEIYHAVGADELPITRLVAIDGGRA